MTLSINEILQRFDKPERQANGSYKVICPLHRDRVPSLSITERDDRILFHCHAGCTDEKGGFKSLLEEINLSPQDVGMADGREFTTWRTEYEDYYKMPIVAVYDYKDENGKYLYSRIRMKDANGKKHMRYATINKAGDEVRYSKGNHEPILYNLDKLVQMAKGYNKYPVYITEGEKDADTMSSMGFLAVSPGSSSGWRREFAKYFTGLYVVILPDNDEAGFNMENTITKDLKHYAYAVKSRIVCPEKEHGDVTDYIENGHTKDKDDLKDLLSETNYIVAPWWFVPPEGSKVQEKLIPDLLAHSILETNDFVQFQDKLGRALITYMYQDGVYKPCSKDLLKKLVLQYIPVGKAKDNEVNQVVGIILGRINIIRDIDSLNDNEMVINLQNGIYSLTERKLLPHSPDVLSSVQLRCKYLEDWKPPQVFISFMEDLCRDDDNIDWAMMNMLQEWIGLALSNIKGYKLKKALLLYSPLGNTGKSVFLSVLLALVGVENVVNIPIQRLSGRFAMGDVFGKRLISAGDQAAGNIDDSSAFKSLTGGDSMRAELKGMQSFEFTFNGVIQMACNDLPSFQDDKGGHVFERLLIAACRNVLPESKRDPLIREKILKERDQIFMWAMKGLERLRCNQYQFTQPGSADEVMQLYRDKLDSVHAFISANAIITEEKTDRINRTEFDEQYVRWCEREDYTPRKKKNIKEQMEKLGHPCKRLDGYLRYQKIKWKPDRIDLPPF